MAVDRMTGQDKRSEITVIDPVEFPILARHWPFLEPNWRSLGQIPAEIVGRIASQSAVDDDDHEAAA